MPFCRRRCGYCNFTLIAGRDELIPAYLDALERELSGLNTPRPVDTLFFGGGTPTHLPPSHLERLLKLATTWFPLAADHEFSVEANPCDIDDERTSLLTSFGVNRLSLGVQSFADEKLAQLERDHRRADVARAIEIARPALRSLAVDLIFGAPGETLDGWRADLAAAIAADVDHVSTYGLTFEKGTSFWSRLHRGQLTRVDELIDKELYESAIDTLAAAGYEHYEVSNFARAGHRCRHNEAYWLGAPYFAAGPGAARFVDGRRELNHRSTTTYIRRVQAGESPVAEREQLSPEDAARERLVFGLRRREGVERKEFAESTGFDIDSLVGDELSRLVEWRMLEWGGSRLRLTRAGLLVSDAIWPHFLRG